jgi:hypothetical protein
LTSIPISLHFLESDFMSLIGSLILLGSVLAAGGEPAPKLPLGKDTTYVTGPLDKDGYINYEAALNDRLGKGVVPEKNANVLIWKALGPTPEGGKRMPAEFFKRLGMEEPPKDGAYFIALRHFVRDQLKLTPDKFDAINDELSRAAQRPWAAKDYPNIAAWLEANEKPLAVVVEATRRPDFFNPIVTYWIDEKPGSLIGALLPSAQRCRELAVALSARAMLRLEERKIDEAWQDLLACHRLGRLVSRGGTLIEGLIGLSIDINAGRPDLAYLERADLTDKQIQDRLQDMQSLPAMSPMADKMDLGERFMYLDSVRLVRCGGMGMLEVLSDADAYKKPDAEVEKALAMIDWTPALRDGNHMFDRMVAAMRLKDRADREKEFDKIEDSLKRMKIEAQEPAHLASLISAVVNAPDKAAGKEIGHILIALLMPAAAKVQNAYDRDEQVQRNVQIAFAVAAYHRDHGGYPSKLDELAPKYLANVPNDLFSGKALIYRPTEKGYLFYSVGVNGKDDGGRSFNDDPAGDDLPVAMPLPELKAKP